MNSLAAGVAVCPWYPNPGTAPLPPCVPQRENLLLLAQHFPMAAPEALPAPTSPAPVQIWGANPLHSFAQYRHASAPAAHPAAQIAQGSSSITHPYPLTVPRSTAETPTDGPGGAMSIFRWLGARCGGTGSSGRWGRGGKMPLCWWGGGGAEAAGPAVLPLRGVVLGLRGAGRSEGKRGAGVGAASCRPKKWGKR